MDHSQITVDRAGATVVITLSRPDRLNAWTPTMADEQAHAMRAAHDDPSIVDRLCAPDELLATALGIADSYAANPDRQLRMTKTLLAGNLAETDLALVQAREQRLLTECWASPEHAEAIDAFLTKRPAVFRPTDATQ